MLNRALVAKGYRALNRTVEIVSIVLLITVTVVVFYSVLLRYVFLRPLAWSEEIARYMFIWLVFLGISLAERSNNHFRVEYFVEKLPLKVRLGVEVFTNLLVFGALAVLFSEGVNYYNQGKSGLSTILLMPLNYIYVALPLAMVLTFLNRIETVRKNMQALLQQIREQKQPASASEQEKGAVNS